jgi:hypothetical protein
MKYFSNFNKLNCLNSGHLEQKEPFCNLVITLVLCRPRSRATTGRILRAKIIMMKANRDTKDFRTFLSIFFAYLVVNFFANLILIVFHLDISSIGNVIFSIISTFLPLISLIETVVHFKKCLKFLRDADEINRRLISRKVIFKIILVLLVMVSQLIILLMRSIFINDLR